MATKTGMRYDDEPVDGTGFWGDTEAQESESEDFDDVADEPVDEMAEAAAQVEENWFERVVRETEEMGPEIAAEMGWQYPPVNASQAENEREPVEYEPRPRGYANPTPHSYEQIAEEQTAAQASSNEPGDQPEEEPEGEPEMDEPSDLDAILAQVDEAMIEAERPIELTAEQLAKGEKVAKQTAVFIFSAQGKGFSRKVNPSQIVSPEYQAAADAKMLRSSKRLIVCDELDAIGRCIRKFKEQVKSLRCPTGTSNLFRGGCWMIPLTNVDKVEDAYREFVPEHKAAVRKFLVVYVNEKRRAQGLQGALFNSQHYPELQSLAGSFVIKRHWVAYDAPAATEEINAVAFRQASAQIRIQVAEAGVAMVDNLRAEAASWINWFTEQLQVGEDGKRKSIADGKYADMVKFFEMAEALNVTGESDFNEVLERGRAAIAGRDVADFKAKGKQRASADELRQQTAAAFEKIKAATDGWVVNAPVRPVYSLDEV